MFKVVYFLDGYVFFHIWGVHKKKGMGEHKVTKHSFKKMLAICLKSIHILPLRLLDNVSKLPFKIDMLEFIMTCNYKCSRLRRHPCSKRS